MVSDTLLAPILITNICIICKLNCKFLYFFVFENMKHNHHSLLASNLLGWKKFYPVTAWHFVLHIFLRDAQIARSQFDHFVNVKFVFGYLETRNE